MANNIIDILGVNTLALRGLGTEFNKFSRFFKSKAEAQQAVATGDYVPTPGQQNAVLVLGVGIMVYSFDCKTLLVWLSCKQLATKLTSTSNWMVSMTTSSSLPLLVVLKQYLTFH